MLTVAELVATMGLDSGAFDCGMSDAGAKFDSTGNELTTKSSGLGKKAGMALAAAGTAALAGLSMVVKTGIGECMEASAAQAQLAAGIKSTGGAAGVTVGHLTNLASSIQNYSGQTDDSIMQTEALLLTFKNIKNVGADKIFDQATKAAADMAAKMGTDASSAAIQLGKALNDPIKGVGSLSRVGVQFTEAQKKQIAAMVESGDTMGAQKIILKELNEEFGGAAKAAGDSLPGQIEKAKRSFEDMSESLMSALMPTISKLVGFLTDLIKKFDSLPGSVKTVIVIGTAIGGLLAVLAPVISAMTTLGPVLALLTNPIGLVIAGIAALAAGLVIAYKKSETFRDIVNAVWGAIKDTATTVWAAIKDVVLAAVDAIRETISTGMAAAKAVWDAVWALFGPLVTAVWDNIKTIVQTAITVVQSIIKAVMALIHGDWGTAWNAIKEAASAIWDGIKSVVRNSIDAVEETISRVLDSIKSVWSSAWNGLKSIVSSAWNGIKEAVSDGIGKVLDLIRSLPGKIKSALGNLDRLLYSVGEDIVRGLLDGITASWHWVTDKLSSLVDSLSSAAKKVLGIGSPSRVFAGLGVAIGQGLAEGIAGSRGQVSAAVAGLVNIRDLGLGNMAFAGVGGGSGARVQSITIGKGAVQVDVHVDGGVASDAGQTATLARTIRDGVTGGLTELALELRRA